MTYDSHNPSLKLALKATRNEVIEECAQAAERELIRISDVLAAQIAAAIRALKDKP